MAALGGGSKQVGLVGIACASVAVAIGLLYLSVAGAPMRYLALNGAAFAVGLAAYATVRVPGWRLGRGEALILPGLAMVLLAPVLFGAPVEEASRWLTFGPLNLQLSLILVPAMLVAFARRADGWGAAGFGIASLALALQPDRAMAGVLVVGVAALALVRPQRWTLAALAAAAGGFGAAMVQPDALPAVPYVDQIFYTSFALSPALGVALIAGVLLLALPGFLAARAGGDGRFAGSVFAAAWLAVAAAAAVGNYPTPLVGYGGSAIVGYLLSLALLPRVPSTGSVPARRASGTGAEDDRPSLFAAAA